MNEIVFYSYDAFLKACRNLVEARSDFSVKNESDGNIVIVTQNCQVGQLLTSMGVNEHDFFERI